MLPFRLLQTLMIALPLLTGCANFENLKRDLKITNQGYTVSVQLADMPNQGTAVIAFIMRWDQASDQVTAGDHVIVGASGAFAFVVKEPDNQFIMCFADQNQNRRYDVGEPAWMHGHGKTVTPITFTSTDRRSSLNGHLSKSTRLPRAAIIAARKFVGTRTYEQASTGHGATMQLGKIVDPDDAQFTSATGTKGLWAPANFAFKQGVGIYFLEKYDSSKTPVIFVHGAAGSPQDWKDFFRRFDDNHFQIWFYVYPSGSRLNSTAKALNDGIDRLQQLYHFRKIRVVAHSMGGLVSFKAVADNAESNNNLYDMKLVTISTPFGGHEAAEMGVKMAPTVVPSWIDLAPNSSFQRKLFKKSIKGKFEHHIIFGYRGKKSYSLPRSNDGTVSVASQLKEKAQNQAASVHGFNEDHMSILSNKDVIKLVEKLLK